MSFLNAYYLFQSPLSAAAGSAQISFQIPPGMGLTGIALELQKNQLIRSRPLFEIYSFLVGKAGRLKPGRYSVDAGIPIPGLVDILSAGPKDVFLTIVPGMTLAEIDEKLSALGVINPGDLTSLDISSFKDAYPWLTKFTNTSIIEDKVGISPEGFVLPDTYQLSSVRGAKATLGQFLNNFQSKALPLFSNNYSAQRILITASILEKEAPDYSDRQIIAGILNKRLQERMPLQVDATVIYAKCGRKFAGCPALTPAGYRIDSPYNTYIYTGLPPGPISNPGLDALKAALNAKKSAYWYYLSDPKTKKIIFSATLDEHNDARVRYLLAR